ncbi:DUF523 domain-containing protein [Peptacetobacter sp.]|uniref:DUF523 domain-containing protein n=1 Tax=Peptacetobacter sp. TaxID=2991975 RepID=UPI002637F58E|nr:DUF523 domain-containing protein [Peptacetobacter sp.]
MIAVSACLIGENCKYNGGNNKNETVLKYLKGKEYITICPECSGGLETPREAAEIIDGEGIDVIKNRSKVISRIGKDVTNEYLKGAKISLEEVKKYNVKEAILKEGSPSCGVNKIHNGEFKGIKKSGKGVTASLFEINGIEIISEKDLENQSIKNKIY